MINNIKKLISKIHEDYNSDKKNLEEAKSAFKMVLESLSRLEPEKHGWEYYSEKIKDTEFYGIYSTKILSNYGLTLVIASPYKKEISKGGHYASSKKLIYINPYIDIDKDTYWSDGGFNINAYSMKCVELFKHAYDVRHAFIHEFTHYLDDLVYDDGKKVLKNYIKPEPDHDKYLHQPIEYNANFQSFLDRLEEDLKSWDLQDLLKLYTRWDSFKTYIDNHYTNFIRDYKDSDVIKSAYKRLYQYYMNTKKDLLDKEAHPEENFKNQLSNLFNEKGKGLIRSYLVGDKSKGDKPSLLNLTWYIIGQLPLYRNYIVKSSKDSNLYNEKYADILTDSLKHYYPSLIDEIEEGRRRWHEETGW